MQNHTLKITALIVSTFVFSGCATSTQNYTPPTTSTIQNTKQSSKPFDDTWDNLVRQLSSDFFVINNIDKNSRLINLSFSSQTPSDFVDCGQSLRTFKNAQGEQTYNYKTADSATFSSTLKDGTPFNVRRITNLEGRTNIYVAPEGKGTLVTVNTKYVVRAQITASTFDGRRNNTENITWDFSTKQGQTGEIQCQALGVIERRILTMVGE